MGVGGAGATTPTMVDTDGGGQSNASTPVASMLPTSSIVVVDGSQFDPKQPYLFATLVNHTLQALAGEADEVDFDATSNRIIASISTHDRCGVLVSSERHEKLLQNLGYPVVRWGQKVAFPMSVSAIEAMGGPYSGALTVHSFTEPRSLHNSWDNKTKMITGDGKWDGLNHMAGAYINLALALKCATDGETHVNLQTKNSGEQEHSQKSSMIVSGNFTSLCFTDKTGGSDMADNIVTPCTGYDTDYMPLKVGKLQIKPHFERLVDEMAGGPASSFIATLRSTVKTFQEHVLLRNDKKFEQTLRTIASTYHTENTLKTNDPGCGDEIGDVQIPQSTDVVPWDKLNGKDRIRWVVRMMDAMEQPLPIGAPTMVVSDPQNPTAPDDRGDKFVTHSFAIESHFKMEGGVDIHQYTGIDCIVHALMLSQISSADAAKIVTPFARADSEFLCCDNPSCQCQPIITDEAVCSNNDTTRGSVPVTASGKFERMLQGVSRNISLTNTQIKQQQLFPETVNATAKPNVKPVAGIECTATKTFSGKCKCYECVSTKKLLHLTQLVTSCTHAFQKCDNYVADQTVCAVDSEGVLKYKPTESMFPWGTLEKSMMMKTSPEGEVMIRIGMNADDCENFAFQGMNMLDTLMVAASHVSGAYFHESETTNANNTPNPKTGVTDDETIRCMRLGNLPKQDQRNILLIAQVIGEKVKARAGYFVTGAPSQENDTKQDTPKTASALCNTHKSCSSTTTKHIELPRVNGNGVQAFGSKTPGRRVAHSVTTDNAKDGSLSGHCTPTLNVMRKDGKHVDIAIVEGTGYVVMGKGGTPYTVKHRATLTAGEKPMNKEMTKKVGHFNGRMTMEKTVDETRVALMSTHVALVCMGMSVPDSTMRPSMYIGSDEDVEGNIDDFYKELVSTGGYQCVQRNGENGIDLCPGVSVKKLVNQGVVPVITQDVYMKGTDAVIEAMGESMCALIEVVNTKLPNFRKFQDNCTLLRRALSPPRVSVALQDRDMRGLLDTLSSLKVNFPDDNACKQNFGQSTRTFFTTTVANDESKTGREKVLADLINLVAQKNAQYENVRFAAPIVTVSGEIITMFRFYGAPIDPMFE